MRKKYEKLSQELINEFINYYTNNIISLNKLSKMFDVSVDTIRSHFKKNGIQIINRQNQTNRFSNIFEIIDTEEKAYWLGFLYADGYLNRTQPGHIELGLKKDDYNHIEKFKKFINSDNKISYRSETKSYRLSFSDSKMYKDLINHGCLERKSLILKAPNINCNLRRHFIRGYVDGDGCLTYSKNNPLSMTINIIGTEDVLKFIYKSIFEDDNFILLQDNRFHNEYTKYITLGREKSRIASYILYEDSKIYLQRKFDRHILTKTAVLDRDIHYYDRVKSVKSEMTIPR